MKSSNPNSRSFEQYYYKHISVNEGCGCAELLVRNHEPDTEIHTVKERTPPFTFLKTVMRLLGKGLLLAKKRTNVLFNK